MGWVGRLLSEDEIGMTYVLDTMTTARYRRGVTVEGEGQRSPTRSSAPTRDRQQTGEGGTAVNALRAVSVPIERAELVAVTGESVSASRRCSRGRAACTRQRLAKAHVRERARCT
jgi:hypothetical protein